MPTRTRTNDDADAFDAYGVLKDGRTATVHMTVRDGWREQMHQHLTRDGRRTTKFKLPDVPELEELEEQEEEDAAMPRSTVTDWQVEARRLLADAATAKRYQDAYAEYDHFHTTAHLGAASTASRNPKERRFVENDSGWLIEVTDATATFRGQQEGDQCTLNGAPGHLNAKLECIPDRQDSMTTDAREAAYAEYDRMHGSAWRNQR